MVLYLYIILKNIKIELSLHAYERILCQFCKLQIVRNIERNTEKTC